MNPRPALRLPPFRAFLYSLLLAISTGAAIKSPPGDWRMVDEITALIELPRIPARDFPITDFGAKPGTDALPAIKAAIEAATKAGGGRVVVPAGAWLSHGPSGIL